jgi:hypothetical protein
VSLVYSLPSCSKTQHAGAGANGFEPSTFWSRTKPNSIDAVSLNSILLVLFNVRLDPKMDLKY